MREILVGGILFAVILILGKVVMGSPWFRLQEGFSSGVFNSTTECPAGSTMYMYGGAAYCCSGQIRPDADRAQNSCKLMWTRPDSNTTPSPVFCTLGPSKDGIQNCLAERGGLMQSQGATVCPPQMPNFVMDPSGNSRCCSGPGNSAQTQCLDPNAPSCAPVTGNMFLGQTSCQLLRAQATDGPCPTGFNAQMGSMSLTNANGSSSMLNVYYCSNHSSNCYSPGIIARLNALGYNTKILPVCT